MRLSQIFLPLRKRWNAYWFSEEPVVGLSLFRIAFGISALIYHAPRIIYIPELYTSAGFIWPREPASWLSVIFPLSLPAAYLLNAILFLALIALVIGYRTRVAAILAFATHTYLVLLENFGTNSIANQISIYLLLLAFSHAGEFLSFDAWRRRRTPIPSPIPVRSRAVPQLMIWQLASMYISNAMMKIHFGFFNWITGNIIVWGLMGEWGQPWAYPLIKNIELTFRFFVATGFIIYLFQGFLILFRKTRPYAIVFGLSWHWVTLAFTTISPAWLAWVSVYILLVKPETWRNLFEEWRRKKKIYPRLVLILAVILIFIISAAQGRMHAGG